MPDPIDRLNAALAGRYRLERELGQGGMATVYVAEDIRHHRRVAVKVLRPELSAAIGPDRFLQEIEVTAGLQHPHILPLFDSGDADGLLFYVMPFVAGESLRDRLTREGRLPLQEALTLAGDVAAALGFAHARGIVHRDIKPENILLEDGEGLVADFGIALALARVESSRLTGTGLAIGTPAYMSPEQVAGQPAIDGRSDVYALGCVLYEMLTGAPPFIGPTAQAVLGQRMSQDAPPARSRRPDLPAELDAALARALARDPAARFETPRELVEACSAALPAARPAGRRRLAVGGLLALAAVAAVAIPLWRSGQASGARAQLPAIAELAGQGRFVEAYGLAIRAERWIAGDTTLSRLIESVSDLLTVTATPAGAEVQVQRLEVGGVADSVPLGVAPLRDVRLPRADYRVVVRRTGYAPLERVVSSERERAIYGDAGRRVALALDLLPADSVPGGMVAVPGARYTVLSPDLPLGLVADLHAFFIDRFEVSNERYAEFVRSGGYSPAAHWAEAAAAGHGAAGFVDRTGLPGPRDWVSQRPPAGTERHPVTGVSWYEAAAFCAAEGKRLPTLYEWEKTARGGVVSPSGVIMPWGYASATGGAEGRANFASGGAGPVDAFPFGISAYGAYGMAGNAKEWLANPVGGGYAVTGGSWQDPAYLFSGVGSLPGHSASPAVGFRCARSAGAAEGDQGAGPVEIDPPSPVYRPVDPATFRALLTHYRYDRRPANARGVERREAADWRRERFWIDGVGGDSILAYLYLPNLARPPYQTLVFVPNSAAFFFEPVWQAVENDLGPHIQAGRAVLAVVLKGMLERPWPAGWEPPPPPSVGFRDLMVRHATELRLGMDYLETRADIDSERLGYLGISLGAGSRLPLAAVDDRFRGVVLIGAGIDERIQPTLPEAANFNFAPYIAPPKLVVNGKLDEEHPWITRGLPLWNLLREPKELVLLDGAGHMPPPELRVPPINAFLDRTLGPVAAGSVPQ